MQEFTYTIINTLIVDEIVQRLVQDAIRQQNNDEDGVLPLEIFLKGIKCAIIDDRLYNVLRITNYAKI